MSAMNMSQLCLCLIARCQIKLDSEDSGDGLISDDEDLELPGVLQSLKSGTLPPDLQAMHAVCLLGAGGRDFAALCHAERVLASGELMGDHEDGGLAHSDPQLWAFAQDLLAPVDESYLLASMASLVSAGAKVHPQSHRMLSILRRHFLTKVVDPNQGLDFDEILSSAEESKKVRALTILTTSLKLLLDCARANLAAMDAPGKGKVKTVEQAVKDSTYALKIMIRFQYMLWNPNDSQWSLPQPSMDVSTRFVLL